MHIASQTKQTTSNRGAGVKKPCRRARVTANTRYTAEDEIIIERMMRGNATLQQAEQVALVLPGNRSGEAILIKWRRKEGIYAHPHPRRVARANGGGGGGN